MTAKQTLVSKARQSIIDAQGKNATQRTPEWWEHISEYIYIYILPDLPGYSLQLHFFFVVSLNLL